jgi:hypothetical protein
MDTNLNIEKNKEKTIKKSLIKKIEKKIKGQALINLTYFVRGMHGPILASP